MDELGNLRERAVALMREYVATEEGRTATLHRLAGVVVEIRSRYLTVEGPDWAGRSWDYRQAISEVYAEAGIPPDSQTSIQAALRYHVSNILRERLTPEELAKAGLKSASAKDRIAAQRATLVAAAEEGGLLRRDAKASDLVNAASRTLDAVEARIATATGPERARVAETLQALRRRVENLLAAIEITGPR